MQSVAQKNKAKVIEWKRKPNIIIESLLGFRIKRWFFKIDFHITWRSILAFIRSIFIIIFNTTSRTNARVHSLTISLWLGQRVKGICQSTLRLWKQKDGVLLQVTKGSDVLSLISLLSVILSFSFILSKDDVILDSNH